MPHGQELNQLSARFERAWQGGQPPRIEDFLPPPQDAQRLAVLAELVKIDLEFRWRRGGAATPRLEEYLARFPEIGRGGAVLDLIAEEYWARCQWGDRPSAGEYLARFAAQGQALRERLLRVEAEIAREGVPPRQLPAPPPAGSLVPAVRPVAVVPVPAVGTFLDCLRQLTILSAPQLAELERIAYGDARALARELLQRGWLTPTQANLILQGRSQELLVGPYLLIEKLGQGGVGTVYRARHQHMERVVALKVLKRELITEPEALARFVREAKLAGQLAHAHVVQAFDAGPCGANYFLAMEYVEGIDLGRLVAERGPLPAALAAEYVRQAADGLQHIHERGLVHRDIKPSNMMVARGGPDWPEGLVKVLDLGLARLRHPMVGDAAGQITAPDGMAIGTLDYMAPEQAVDFRGADIRADVYSLGCTFYYLLTGRPPFPDCTVAEKLLRHQQTEPTPVTSIRPDLPGHLLPVLRRMMAKRAADRYQTPGEIAAALPAPAHVSIAVRATFPPAVAGDNFGRRAHGWWRSAPATLSSCLAGRWSRRSLGWVVAGAVLAGLALWAVLAWRGSAPAQEYLSDLPTTAVGPGDFGARGAVRLNNKEVRVSVGGTLSPKGVFMFPLDRGTSYARYRLGKRFQQLHTEVALNDSSLGSPSGLIFAVLGDGRKLWESGPVSSPKDRAKCSVSVKGVDVLELTVTCPLLRRGPDDQWGAHGVWIEPLVSR